MAINRQDYQYVKKTIPTTPSKQVVNELTIGSTVRNLLPTLYDGYEVGGYELNIHDEDNTGWFITNEISIPASKEELITYGTLLCKVGLKANKTYVFQIVNWSHDKISGERSASIASQDGDKVYNINSSGYGYFQVTDDGYYIVKIPRLAWGYELLPNGDLKADYDGKQFRRRKGPAAYPFLFESPESFMVDKKGTIIGINLCSLELPEDSNTESLLDVEPYTWNDLIKIFSNPPVINGNENKYISITIPKYNSGKLKNLSKQDVDKLSTVGLFVYRDRLINSIRRYADVMGRPHEQTNRRGLIRTIQNRKQNGDDPYWVEHVVPKLYIKNNSQPVLSIFDSNTNSFKSCQITADTVNMVYNSNDGVEINLISLCTLGYNKHYVEEKMNQSSTEALSENTPNDIYRYTSICLAWGYIDANGDIQQLSDFSEPIFLDRSGINIDSTNKTLTLENSYELAYMDETDENFDSSCYSHSHWVFKCPDK